MTGRESVTCNCAEVAPTMPTCRSEHLVRCPLYWVAQATAQRERAERLELALRNMEQFMLVYVGPPPDNEVYQLYDAVLTQSQDALKEE